MELISAPNNKSEQKKATKRKNNNWKTVNGCSAHFSRDNRTVVVAYPNWVGQSMSWKGNFCFSKNSEWTPQVRVWSWSPASQPAATTMTTDNATAEIVTQKESTFEAGWLWVADSGLQPFLPCLREAMLLPIGWWWRWCLWVKSRLHLHPRVGSLDYRGWWWISEWKKVVGHCWALNNYCDFGAFISEVEWLMLIW